MGLIAAWSLGLLVSVGGTSSNDIVSLLDAQDYFAFHKIDVTPERMTELASAAPDSPQAQIQQLLAIRWLGDHPEAARRTKSAQATLEQIAAAKKAQDEVGFAKEYAQRALARLAGRPPRPRPALPANSVAKDALAWFPESAVFFGSMDLRRAGDIPPIDLAPIQQFLVKSVPQAEKTAIYNVVDRLGNVQVDRISFAVVAGTSGKRDTKIYIRFTGRGNARTLADLCKQVHTNTTEEKRKGPRGEDILVIDPGKDPPAFAFIGSNELIEAGPEGSGESLPLIDEVLDVRAGKKGSVLAGQFAEELKDMPADASALVLGDVPDQVRQELTGGPFRTLPKTVSAVLTKRKTIQIKATGIMKSDADAKTLVDDIQKLKKMGLDVLPFLPAKLGLKPEQVKLLREALESVHADAKNDTVTASASVSPRAISAVALDLVLKSMMLEQNAIPAAEPPAPPPPR